MTQMEVDNEEMDRLVQECSLYLLNKHTGNVAIKRGDVVKTILNNFGRRIQNEVLTKTKDVLKRVHGLNVLELDENPKSFLLTNTVPSLGHGIMEWDVEENKKMILLTLVLSVIYMNGGSITERGLYGFLHKCRVTHDECHTSPDFGDVDRLLKKEFVDQRYLMYEAVKTTQDDEDIINVIHWGARASNEVSKERILEFVSETYGCQMSDFAEQHADITIS